MFDKVQQAKVDREQSVNYLNDIIIKLREAKAKVEKSRADIKRKNIELETAYGDLKEAQAHILRQEKMASIGQLAAGIAHEINSPLGFITSNLDVLRKYIEKMKDFSAAQSKAVEDLSVPEGRDTDAIRESLEHKKRYLKIDHVFEDIGDLINESIDGSDRIKRIALDLRSFAGVDESDDCKYADINSRLESTINAVWSALEHKARLKKSLGNIPEINCRPGQLNQVFMNILLNAIQSIQGQGEVAVKTWSEKGSVYISIADTGCGMPEDVLNRIFDPFFTTREVGHGMGLGLSMAFAIIKRHNGKIDVESEAGKGTIFTVTLPVNADA